MDNTQETVAPEQTLNHESQLEQCQIQLNDIKNKYMHLLADFDNSKKRQEKEKTQWARLAQVEVISPLLTIIDDFERALAPQGTQVIQKSDLQGFELIYKELKKYLDKLQIQEIVITQGQELDPEFHESVMSVNAELPSGTIVDVLQKGYTFKGFILRPAKVSIAQ